MGIYLRGKIWWISYFVGGRQRFESSRSPKKRDAQQLLDIRKGAAREGRLRLTKTKSPRFDEYAKRFLLNIESPNTLKRYSSSIQNLTAHFGDPKLSDITADLDRGFHRERVYRAAFAPQL